MDAAKGTQGTVEEREGLEGNTLERRGGQTHTVPLLSIYSVPGLGWWMLLLIWQPCWLSSSLPGKTLDKKECGEGGKGIFFSNMLRRTCHWHYPEYCWERMKLACNLEYNLILPPWEATFFTSQEVLSVSFHMEYSSRQIGC